MHPGRYGYPARTAKVRLVEQNLVRRDMFDMFPGAPSKPLWYVAVPAFRQHTWKSRTKTVLASDWVLDSDD